MAIRKFLDISTTHVPPETMSVLLEEDLGNHAISNYGVFLHVPEENNFTFFSTLEGIPQILDHARALDCDYVYLDQDADSIPELRDYESEWD